jgi:hypothetical protein
MSPNSNYIRVRVVFFRIVPQQSFLYIIGNGIIINKSFVIQIGWQKDSLKPPQFVNAVMPKS